MQILIDLPNRYYEMVKDFDTVNIGRCQYKGVQYQVINAIKNGIPLPAGHGRLIDADELHNEFADGTEGYDFAYWCRNDICEVIDNAKSVVEADGGE